MFCEVLLISVFPLTLYDAYAVAIFQQFFLGDYRPLIQDTSGYVLDQVGSLTSVISFSFSSMCSTF